MAMEFPFIERHLILIYEDHIVDADTDIAIYTIRRNSWEGSDRFSEPGDYYLIHIIWKKAILAN